MIFYLKKSQLVRSVTETEILFSFRSFKTQKLPKLQNSGDGKQMEEEQHLGSKQGPHQTNHTGALLSPQIRKVLLLQATTELHVHLLETEGGCSYFN